MRFLESSSPFHLIHTSLADDVYYRCHSVVRSNVLPCTNTKYCAVLPLVTRRTEVRARLVAQGVTSNRHPPRCCTRSPFDGRPETRGFDDQDTYAYRVQVRPNNAKLFMLNILLCMITILAATLRFCD